MTSLFFTFLRLALLASVLTIRHLLAMIGELERRRTIEPHTNYSWEGEEYFTCLILLDAKTIGSSLQITCKKNMKPYQLSFLYYVTLS